MEKILFRLMLSLLAILFIGNVVSAEEIADRGSLNSMLGASGVTEDFETFIITDNEATNIGTTDLNSSTVVFGQGPDLVVDGVVFHSDSFLQWNSEGYYGLPSKNISTTYSKNLTIYFMNPVNAFGLDMLVFGNYNDNASITVFGTESEDPIYSASNIFLSTAQSPVFWGYRDDMNIGKVIISGSMRDYSPLIDSVTFGNVVPEPVSSALFVLGGAVLAFKRRKAKV